MSNGMKALGIVVVVLVLGAVFSGVYGSGWMGFGHHGYGSRSDSEEFCRDAGEECNREGSPHMMFYRNLDISEEDMASIEMIISDAEEQISEILSRYDIEDLRGGRSSGGSCH